MCFSTPKAPPPPPAPPPAPPPVQPASLQSATDEGSAARQKSKGRKSLRIDLASSNVSGSSGLNLPVGQ